MRSLLANFPKSFNRIDLRALVVLGTNVKPFDKTKVSTDDKVWLDRLTMCLERSKVFILPVLPGLCRDGAPSRKVGVGEGTRPRRSSNPGMTEVRKVS